MRKIKTVGICDINVMDEAVEIAKKVDFLDSSDFGRYASALHDAILWGKYIDCKNERLRTRRQ